MCLIERIFFPHKNSFWPQCSTWNAPSRFPAVIRPQNVRHLCARAHDAKVPKDGIPRPPQEVAPDSPEVCPYLLPETVTFPSCTHCGMACAQWQRCSTWNMGTARKDTALEPMHAPSRRVDEQGRISESCQEQGEQASRLFGDWLSLPNQRPHGRDAHAPWGPLAPVATFGNASVEQPERKSDSDRAGAFLNFPNRPEGRIVGA
jgi:hypothetical protein